MADVSLDSTNTIEALAGGSSLRIAGSVGGIRDLAKAEPGLLDLAHTINDYAGNAILSIGTLGLATFTSLGGGNLIIDASSVSYSLTGTAPRFFRLIVKPNWASSD